MNKEEFVQILESSQAKILAQVDVKLQDLKRSISEDQEDCVESVVKKVKFDSGYKWKKVGNEKQFKFNEAVHSQFESAIAAIDRNKLDKAKGELQKGEKSVTDRQKQIKLADRSESVGQTVSAYFN